MKALTLCTLALSLLFSFNGFSHETGFSHTEHSERFFTPDGELRVCIPGKGLLPQKSCVCSDQFAQAGKKLTCSGDSFCNKELVATLCNSMRNDELRKRINYKRTTVLSGQELPRQHFHSHHSMRSVASDHSHMNNGNYHMNQQTMIKRKVIPNRHYSLNKKTTQYRGLASVTNGTCDSDTSLQPGESCLCGSEYKYEGKKLTCAGKATCNFSVVNTVCGTHHAERNIKNQGFHVLHRTNSGRIKYRPKYSDVLKTKRTKVIKKTNRQLVESDLDSEIFKDETEDFNESFSGEMGTNTRDIATSDSWTEGSGKTSKTTIIKKTTRTVIDDDIDLDELIEDEDW